MATELRYTSAQQLDARRQVMRLTACNAYWSAALTCQHKHVDFPATAAVGA
jgi:hypothetical protein